MDMMPGARHTVKIAIAFCLVLLPCSLASAQQIPEYSGAYAGALVWEGEINMIRDVLILQSGSLTIRAGTRVNVFPAEGTKIDPEYLSSQTELLVRGRIDIQGTPQAPVRFVIIDKETTEQIAWAGITLENSSESRIRHAQIDRADIGIRCVRSSPEIVGNSIQECRYGIVAQSESHPKVVGNQLTDGEGGIFCWNNSNPDIQDNRIVNHDEEALFVDASSRPRLGHNLVSNNTIGLALYSRTLTHQDVESIDNQQNLRWLGQQGWGVSQ
jgi:parallel beta-helix repeat protein